MPPAGATSLHRPAWAGVKAPSKLFKTVAKTPRPRRRCSTCRASNDPGSEENIPDTLPIAGVDSDWRAFRAKLVASTSGRAPEAVDEEALWAHSIPGPEQGCLLVSHPLMFTSAQTYFFQSVILIFSHNETGSAGLILNRWALRLQDWTVLFQVSVRTGLSQPGCDTAPSNRSSGAAP